MHSPISVQFRCHQHSYVNTGPKKPLRSYFLIWTLFCSKTYVSIFFHIEWWKCKTSAWKSMLLYPMSPVHSKSVYMSFCFINILPFHLPSPYHAVIIRLATKKYYFCIFSAGVLEECVAKSDHRYVIDFSKHKFRKQERIGMLLRVIIK